MNVILSILVVAGLLFGGGATVQAAQDDLPNEPLYAVKTLTENISLQIQNNQEDKVNKLMELVQVRVQEMVQLSEDGEPIPEEVPLRLEQHIRQAMQVAINMDDATLDQTLLQVRERLQAQERVMEQLQANVNPDAEPVLLRTQAMLQLRIQLLDEGLQNQEMFRNAVRNGQEDEFTPPAQNENGQQNGEPNLTPGEPNQTPGGPNTEPGGPNTEPGGPNTEPGGPNTEPGGPNTDPTGPSTEPGGPNTEPGSGTGTPSPDPGNGNGSGGGGKP